MTNLKYNIIQGINFPIRVYSQNAIMIIKGPTTILQFNNVTETDGQLFLNILIDLQNYIDGGIYQFQLFENNLLKESGALRVSASLLVNPDQDLRSRYAVIVEAIQHQIAGVASNAEKIVKAGDKQIQYYSASQLMALLTYFKGKLDEENGQYGNVNTANDQMVQKYVFKIR